MSNTDPDDDFQLLGRFPILEARRMITTLEREEIRFEIDFSNTPSETDRLLVAKDLPPWIRPPSQQPGLQIYVHREDRERLLILLQKQKWYKV